MYNSFHQITFVGLVMKNKTLDQLNYIISDASEAAEAMKSLGNYAAEAKYRDQVNDAVTEKYRRAMKISKKDPTAELEAKVSALTAALSGLVTSVNVAFEYDGDVFGCHHNDAVDNLAAAESLLSEMGK